MDALNNELEAETTLQSLQYNEALKNQIVERLKTPDQIVRFVSLLIQELKKEKLLERKATENIYNKKT